MDFIYSNRSLAPSDIGNCVHWCPISAWRRKQEVSDWRGVEWFNEKYKPTVGKIGLVALLVTLIVLFSLNGKVMIENPDLLILVSIPLLLGFLIVVVYNLLITRTAALAYQEGVSTVIIGSSSHFEIVIAAAISMYGVGP